MLNFQVISAVIGFVLVTALILWILSGFWVFREPKPTKKKSSYRAGSGGGSNLYSNSTVSDLLLNDAIRSSSYDDVSYESSHSSYDCGNSSSYDSGGSSDCGGSWD